MCPRIKRREFPYVINFILKNFSLFYLFTITTLRKVINSDYVDDGYNFLLLGAAFLFSLSLLTCLLDSCSLACFTVTQNGKETIKSRFHSNRLTLK